MDLAENRVCPKSNDLSLFFIFANGSLINPTISLKASTSSLYRPSSEKQRPSNNLNEISGRLQFTSMRKTQPFGHHQIQTGFPMGFPHPFVCQPQRSTSKLTRPAVNTIFRWSQQWKIKHHTWYTHVWCQVDYELYITVYYIKILF